MPLTPDKKKSAYVGVVLTVIGLGVLMYGTQILPAANQNERLFSSLMLIIFGLLLSLSSLLIFVLPAAYDYLGEAFSSDEL